MIEINVPIEDLRYDPISRKYRVVKTDLSNKNNNAKSFSTEKNHTNNNVTLKIKPQKLKTNRNLIERKGLHVDFVVK